MVAAAVEAEAWQQHDAAVADHCSSCDHQHLQRLASPLSTDISSRALAAAAAVAVVVGQLLLLMMMVVAVAVGGGSGGGERRGAS